MPVLVPSWNTKRVFGTWLKTAGTEMRPGTYKVSVPVRVTNATDDVIIPSGVYDSGTLNVTPGVPSLDVLIPCTDDSDNSPIGWQVTIDVVFPDAAGEKYVIDVPVAGGDINLRTIVLTESIPAPTPVLIRGVPGGIAELDADGDVIDAAGDKVTGGGGLDETALATYLADGEYATAADLAPKADASAVTSALALKAPLANPAFTGTPTGITKTHVGLANVDNTSDAAKPVSTAQATAIGLKANSASPTFTGTITVPDASFSTAKVSGLDGALAAKAPTASPTFTGTVSGVTKTHVGLGNVDNTADTAKPVSTAQQAALDAKVPTSRTVAGKALTANVTLVAADVGAMPTVAVPPVIYSTALNTWPVKSTALTALGLTGYSGRVVWHHLLSHGSFAAGVNPTVPATAGADDAVEWTVS